MVYVQWNQDTLGPVILSLVGRLSFLGSLKCISTMGKITFGDMKGVPCREVVPFSECPLSEVLLYHHNNYDEGVIFGD